MSGDPLYRMDDSDLVRFHREKQADVSLAVLPVSAEGEEDQERKNDAIRDGIVVIPKLAVIPDGMTI
jgi:ADP-glucose pyrophosphorylase